MEPKKSPGKKKRNLKRLRLRFHQRRRFWRIAPPPEQRQRKSILAETPA
jgi:hypothetical protein